MKIHTYKNSLLVGALSFLLIPEVHAGIPVWTFSAPNPASVTVSSGSTETVQYTVTNQSSKPKNLIMKPVAGLSASSCYLPTKGSTCILTLTINGSAIPSEGIHTGPILCEQSNASQCYQPSQANSLNIRVTALPQQTTISVAPANIALLTNPGDSDSVTVTNNGTEDAYDINATVASPNLNVAVSATTCGSVLGHTPPNNTCTITFEMGSTKGETGTTSASIQGTNTNLQSVSIKVGSSVAPVLNITSPVLANRVIPVNAGSLDINVENDPSVIMSTSITAVLPPAWGSDVSVSYSNCTDVVPGGTCTLHFEATAPFVADQITINGTNGADSLTTYVAFRDQGGLVFSVDGGVTKVVTEANVSSSIEWGEYDYEIGGINEQSIAGVGSCDGKNDGACNTQRIVNCLTSLNDCVDTPPLSIDINTYAAGLCTQYNGGSYSDWYSPAICEWSNSDNSCSIDNIYTNLSQHGFGGFTSIYWSSTEATVNPKRRAWVENFVNSIQDNPDKDNLLNARCVRSF